MRFLTIDTLSRCCICLHAYYAPPVPAPGQASVIGVTLITATSISLSWSVPSGSVVTSSEVLWRVFGSSSTTEADGSGTSGSITSTSYTIQELESGTNYSITVTVANAAGNTVSHPILIATSEEDSMYTVYNLYVKEHCIS